MLESFTERTRDAFESSGNLGYFIRQYCAHAASTTQDFRSLVGVWWGDSSHFVSPHFSRNCMACHSRGDGCLFISDGDDAARATGANARGL